eukprot:scaffold75489_cov32-Tisochrysis_lutea.AAC.2
MVGGVLASSLLVRRIQSAFEVDCREDAIGRKVAKIQAWRGWTVLGRRVVMLHACPQQPGPNDRGRYKSAAEIVHRLGVNRQGENHLLLGRVIATSHAHPPRLPTLPLPTKRLLQWAVSA